MRAHYRNDIAAVPLAGTSLAPVGGATVHLYQEGTSTPITETIYAGPSSATTLSNPLTSGVNGTVEFFLQREKRLDLLVSKGGFTDQRITVDVEKTVLDEFDVRDYGAVGDGVTDDTVAINAAITAMPNGGGTLRFGLGKYLVSSTIDMSAKAWFRVQGVGFRGGGAEATDGSVLFGNINGDLFKFVPAGSGTTFVLDGMTFLNTHANGVAVHLERFGVCTVENCQIKASSIGLSTDSSAFSLTVRQVKFNGQGNLGIGMIASGHTTIEGCDVTGWLEGIRASGSVVNIQACRLEVNVTAMRLGVKADGSTWNLAASLISGNAFEANDTAIEIVAVVESTLSNMLALGTVNAPSGQSKIGLTVAYAAQTVFDSVYMGGEYSDASIRINTGSGAEQTWRNVRATNVFPTGKLWDVRSDLTNITFQGCNYTFRPDDTTDLMYAQRVLRLGSIAGIDYLSPSVQGKNFRHVLAVGGGATTLAVTFTAAGHGPGNSAINTATATAGAGLADGTYYYLGTALTARGEATGTSEKTVVCGGGNNQVTLVFFPMTTDGFKRRIYRGIAPGIYDGYYETALNSNANFVDTGTALARRQSQPLSGIDPTDMREPDANYGVFVSPDWDTRWWITAKATTGYTINFGTAAPGGGGTVWVFYVR